MIGLEAAHIKWHAAGGPDEVANGLALCGLHHKAFDRGALGLEPVEAGGYRVLVSSEVHGLSAPVRWFLDYHDSPLRAPRNTCLGPDPRFVKWHEKEVFRRPALGVTAATRGWQGPALGQPAYSGTTQSLIDLSHSGEVKMRKPDIRELYYITHRDNLPSILELGILSHDRIQEKGVKFTPVYDEDRATFE